MSSRTLAEKFLWLFLPMLLLAPARAQYGTTYSTPLMDITPQIKSGTNAWKYLPKENGAGNPQCLQNSASATDGTFWCVGTDHYPYRYDPSTKTWTKYAAMGTSVVQMVVQNVNNVFSMQRTSQCGVINGNQYYGLFHWTGTAWTQPAVSCATNYSIGNDGFLTQAGWDSAHQVRALYYSTDNGVTWTYWSDSWLFVDMWSKDIGCAITTSNVAYEVSQSEPAVSLGSPGGTLTGCFVLPLDNDAVVAWNSVGQVFYEDDGTWHSLAGLNVGQIVGTSKAAVFALGLSYGYPYHLNFYAGASTGTTFGQYITCPMPGANGGAGCTQTMYHNSYAKVNFPHGIGGQQNGQDVIWNQAINYNFWDAAPLCDPFIGDLNDPECVPTTTGDSMCEQSGTDLGSPGEAPQPQKNISHNRFKSAAYLGYNSWQDAPTYTAGDGRWHIQVHIPVNSNCAYGSPTCQLSDVILAGQGIYDFRELVSSRSLPVARALASVLPSTGPWLMISAYIGTPGTGAGTCAKLSTNHDPVGGFCD